MPVVASTISRNCPITSGTDLHVAVLRFSQSGLHWCLLLVGACQSCPPSPC